jgi:transposase
MRKAIRIALQQHDDPTTRTRLMAVDALVLGNSAQAVAREFKRAPKTVKHWLAMFLREGLTALLGRPRRKAHPKGPTTPPSFRTLRVLAASERRPRIRHRLRMMALLASQLKDDGSGNDAKDDLARMWREVSPALLPKPPHRLTHGRDRRLNKQQQEILRGLILAQPGISGRELCAFVDERFGVTYSEHWMGQLVRRQIGLERVDGRFKVLDLAERGNGSRRAGTASAAAAPRSRRLRG